MRKGWVILSIVVLARCQSGAGGAATATGPCSGGGSPNPNAPIVCIDRSALDQPGYQPDPNPVPANRGVHMEFWFIDGGGEMSLCFSADTPVHNITCNGGHCSVTVDPNVPPHAHIQRKYEIFDRATGKHLDPEVIIEP